MNKILEEKKKEETRRVSIKESAFSHITANSGDSYISAFIVALTSNPLPISFLSSFPAILSPIAQIYGSKLIESKSRKEIVTKFVFLQALMWLPIALMGFLFYKGILLTYLPYLVVLFYSILAFLGGITGPAWFSWAGDIVDEKQRGAYFSRRNKIGGTVGLIVFIIGAFLLDLFKTIGIVSIGFSILFAVACTSRLVAYMFFKKEYEPKFKLEKDYYFTFWQFVNRHGNFFKFTVFHSLLSFAMALAGPFFTAYMLLDLGFGYLTYTTVVLSSTLYYILFLPFVGRFSDNYGDKQLLYISSILFALYPLLWFFIESPIVLIFLPQLIAGFATAAFSIAVTNFVYSTVTPQRRAICVAYMNVLIGIGVFIGAILGGIIVKTWHPSNINPILFVFLVSAGLRFIVPIILIPKIEESKKAKKISLLDFPAITKLITGEGRGLKESIQQSLLMRLVLFNKAGKK